VTEDSFWLPAQADSSTQPGPHPLLAYGANRSREGLTHKLGAPSPPVAAVHGWLRDFDVVYSAHISPYGAIPATLQHSPGTEVSVHVLHLYDAQLAAIDRAEPNYELATLEGLAIELDGGSRLQTAYAYLSRHGCLSLGGAECALSAIRARRRAFAEHDQEAMLTAVRDRLAPGTGLEDFILGGLADQVVQGHRTAALRADARAFTWAGRRALEH